MSQKHARRRAFNGPLSGTTRVSRYQKGNTKTNLDFTEARDSEWQWHQLGRMQVCTSLHLQQCIMDIIHYMDSPDCLLVPLSISVFLLFSFSVLHF